MGPHVGGDRRGGTVAADLDTAEAAIDALEADALTAQAQVNIPITSCTNAGAPLVAFARRGRGIASWDPRSWATLETVRVGVLAVTVPLRRTSRRRRSGRALAGFASGADTTTVLAVGGFSSRWARLTPRTPTAAATHGMGRRDDGHGEKTVTIAARTFRRPCLDVTIERGCARRGRLRCPPLVEYTASC
jgi:hypothetical protein